MNLRNIMLKLMNLFDIFQKGEFHECILGLKDILYLMPATEGEDWTYSPMAGFVLKMFDMVAMLFSGSGNSVEISQLISDCLEFLQVPKEISMFITLIPTSKYSNSWQFKDLKIETMEQLQQFIQKKIFSKLEIKESQADLLSRIFIIVFKVIRGETNLDTELFDILKDLFEELGKKIFKNADQQAIKMVFDFKDGVFEISRLISLVLSLTTNHYSKM